MVWQIRHNFDLEGGKAQLNVRVPFVESQMLLDPDMDYPEEFKVSIPNREADTQPTRTP